MGTNFLLFTFVLVRQQIRHSRNGALECVHWDGRGVTQSLFRNYQIMQVHTLCLQMSHHRDHRLQLISIFKSYLLPTSVMSLICNYLHIPNPTIPADSHCSAYHSWNILSYFIQSQFCTCSHCPHPRSVVLLH